MADGEQVVLDRGGLDALVASLLADGYSVVGPTVRDGAIVLAELTSGAELPDGWGVQVGPGEYRLQRRSDAAVFAHSSGPQSWKQFLHPPRRALWSTDGSGQFVAADADAPRYAFVGVRACDLAALGRLTRVLGAGDYVDSSYSRRRAGLFVVAVGCTEPGELCFCASLGTGPQPGPGYDISLTERVDDTGPSYVAGAATDSGRELLARLPSRPASPREVGAAEAAVAGAADRMGRTLPDDVPALLRDQRSSPLWEEIAQRCLTCGSCTMACPTCFCTTTEDRTDLTGEQASRSQRWASCFELEFSYVHGGVVRGSGASRYRHWMTHKLSSWHDQFGESGCVGCGRCIAWCPVGIDITAELNRMAGVTRGGSSDDHVD